MQLADHARQRQQEREPGGRHQRDAAAGGKLTNVSVHTSGDPVTGTMNGTATAWHSTWALGVSTHYTVTATGQAPDGQSVTQTSTFTTLTPASTFQTMIFEGQGATYGVGMPIILDFSQPIKDKAAVERALQLRTSSRWSARGTGTAIRPSTSGRRRTGRPNTTVSFTGHLNGVEGAPGVYGYHTLTQSFRIGDSLIVVASTATHYMNLYRNGKLLHALAHQHRALDPAHPERHLPDDRQGQPGAHEGTRLQRGSAVVGAVHLDRRLPA